MSDAWRTAPPGRPFVSYAETLLEVLGRQPDRPAVTTPGGLNVSAAVFRDATHRLARALVAHGAGAGQTVALLAGNTVEALSARYAATLAGARLVYLYEVLPPEALAHIVNSVGSPLLLVDSSRHADLQRLLPLVHVPKVMTLGPAPHGEDILAEAARLIPAPLAMPVDPHDDWCIRHTSGTTGIPKAIQVTHRQYRRCLESLRVHAGSSPRYLANTPLSHVAGLCTDLTLLQGGSVVLQHAFEPGEALSAIARESITHMWVLPPLLHQLLDHPDLTTTDVSSIKRITYGGSPASAARLRQATDVFGPVLYSWYGQSETLGLTEVGPEEHTLTGRHGQVTVGRTMPGVQIVIRDEHNETVPPGEQGEILARSPGMMRGYFDQPQLTAETMQNGWVRTGDIGYLDDNGYLFLVGRCNDMIKVRGGGIYPSEVEAVLLTHPSVAQCAVFSISDHDATEHVHAAVVPARGHHPEYDDLHAFVTARKGSRYAPRAVHLLDAIPQTPVGKPDRHKLRELIS
ncbi:AMP-binding protein [Streptomyces sp. NPDC006553]|uniref:class I adenylate-forming enzyme family protein n=1 Tax=Streptomyces sp. NPDC006553 TaxID=3157180 RepID=UPI0033AFC798